MAIETFLTTHTVYSSRLGRTVNIRVETKVDTIQLGRKMGTSAINNVSGAAVALSPAISAKAWEVGT